MEKWVLHNYCSCGGESLSMHIYSRMHVALSKCFKFMGNLNVNIIGRFEFTHTCMHIKLLRLVECCYHM